MKTRQLKYYSLNINNSYEGNTIEQQMFRAKSNGEAINNIAKELIYTERKEGVRPSTNIRTDRWEIALDATEKIAKSYKARREDFQINKENIKDEKNENPNNNANNNEA